MHSWFVIEPLWRKIVVWGIPDPPLAVRQQPSSPRSESRRLKFFDHSGSGGGGLQTAAYVGSWTVTSNGVAVPTPPLTTVARATRALRHPAEDAVISLQMPRDELPTVTSSDASRMAAHSGRVASNTRVTRSAPRPAALRRNIPSSGFISASPYSCP
jgi:hypothetical protein